MDKQHRILAVDDNPLNLEIFTEILGDDYQVSTAASGEEALKQVRANAPDLILLDIMMPGIDGYDVTRTIREDPNLGTVKIILVSAKSQTFERLQGYEAGADDYITKPFDSAELEAKVRVFLKLKHAEELDTLKAEMLQLLNHETRTPMQPIIAALDVLSVDAFRDEEEQKQMVDLARKGCDRLMNLFEKVGLLCEFRSSSIELNVTDIPIDALFAEAVYAVRQGMNAQQVEVLVDVDAAARLQGDRDYLKRVIVALLDNAIRFSSNDGKVEVRVMEEDRHTVIAVCDHGAGIAPTHMPYIFSAFSSADINSHSQGHGLSLNLCQEIVQQHGGTIHVESTIDHGSKFVMRLPLVGDLTPGEARDKSTVSLLLG